MKIGLFFYTDFDSTDINSQLSTELNLSFGDKYYGSGIKTFNIRVVCVEPIHQKLFKFGKPQYIAGVKQIKRHGISLEIENAFFYHLRIDFDQFIKSDFITRNKVVIKDIYNSLILIKPFLIKINDFDYEKFLLDYEEFVKKY